MKLSELKIKNFRGYRNETAINISNSITGITGKNDAGKSTILEALDIFFDGGEVTLDKDDFNIQAEEGNIEITCSFADLPREIIIDEANKTTLQAEYLLDNESKLTIKKIFKRSSLKKPEIYLVANHPTKEKFNDLHLLKIADLKKRAQELNVNLQSGEDARTSSAWRQAIWRSADNLNISPINLDVSKFSGDSKQLQDKIFSLLPLFALFRSDRESKDSDHEAKNPLQEAVKQAQSALKEQIDAIQTEIQNQVFERANRTLEKLKEMDPALAAQLVPRFKTPPKWTFDFTLDGDGDVPINKRGSGVRRLIILNFFRAEAERRVLEKSAPSVIYAIEEPETSQHPSNQEMLVRALIELGNQDTCQILVTTHVPALASLLPIDGLRFIDKNDQKHPIVKFGDDQVLNEICNSLGVLPEFNSKSARALILVEGPGDIIFLSHLANALKQTGDIKETLEDKKIFPIWIGGTGNLKHWQTKKMADAFGIPWAVLMDSDLGTNEFTKNQQQISELQSQGKKAYLTKKRESENYISPDLICQSLGITGFTFTDVDDAKKLIARVAVIRDSHVLERFWPMMSPEQIKSAEKYVDSQGKERFEFSEMIQDFLTLVD